MAEILKYQIGDKVRVRKDLLRDGYYHMSNNKNSSNLATPSMRGLGGQIVTIKECDGQYQIEEPCSYCWWTDEMFEEVNRK